MNIRKERVYIANLNLWPMKEGEEKRIVKEEIVIEFKCGKGKRYVPITFIKNALEYYQVKLSLIDGYSNHPKALSTEKPGHFFGCARVLFVSDIKPKFNSVEANEKISISDLRKEQAQMNRNGAIKDKNWNWGYKQYKDTLVENVK